MLTLYTQTDTQICLSLTFVSLTGISNYGNTNNVTKHLILILREGKFKEDGIHT